MSKIIGLCRVNKLVTILLLTTVIAACGGKGVIVTKDNSADYRNVKSLPPLKKPARESSVSKENELAIGRVEEPTHKGDYSVDDASSSTEPTKSPDRQFTGNAPSYRVVEEGAQRAWLEINSDINTAWDYLSTLLGGSDLTVHHRNKTASLIAIGCGNTEGADTAKTKSRWSVFKKKHEPTEHCALRLVSSKDKTNVIVLVAVAPNLIRPPQKMYLVGFLNREGPLKKQVYLNKDLFRANGNKKPLV